MKELWINGFGGIVIMADRIYDFGPLGKMKLEKIINKINKIKL